MRTAPRGADRGGSGLTRPGQEENTNAMPRKPDPVEALLQTGPRRIDLPGPAERERLRTAYGLSRTEVAEALAVARSTVAAWEAGRSEPQGGARAAYAKLLQGMAAQLALEDADTAVAA